MTDQRDDDLSLPSGEADAEGPAPANDVIADAQQVPMDDAAGGPQADDPDEMDDDGTAGAAGGD